ncbi:MAG TPA: outer-membrane lipoprotein carrier protein LolA [bacterium]|nr:outer-membrane lipoprotein carrier protein LolA [bacterium]
MIAVLLAARLLLLAATPAAAPAGSPVPVADKEATAVAGKVQKVYEGVKELSADFEQETILRQGGKVTGATSGKVWIAKPGKMRWEYLKPEVKTIVSDGKTLWMYDGEENQVVINEHMDESESFTALNFLGGLGQLTKSFDVKRIAAPARAKSSEDEFLALTPKPGEDLQVAEIDLGIAKKTNLADEVFLVDQLGNQTHLVFHELKTNAAAPAKTFTFDIPKNAEVVKPTVLKPAGK